MFMGKWAVLSKACFGVTIAFVIAAMLQAASAFAGDTVYYYYTDSLHSAVAVTDAQGNVLERTYYAPYGQVLNRDFRDGPGYTGHEEDPETGLVYMQQRYYCPECGRFLSVDPVDVDPTSGGNFNRYEYANDNPYRYTDPDGRQVGEVPVVIAACAASPPCAGAVAVGVTALAVAAKKAGDSAASYYDHVMQSQQSKATSPALPKGLVGVQDAKSGQKGHDKTHDSGPLAPTHGGTGDAESDFGKLTGGQSAPAAAGKGYPPGTTVGENGISIRPAKGDKGPRIDIPANGNKPPETLHYPKPPPKIDGGN